LTTKINLELFARDAVKGVKRGDVIIIIDVLRCSSTIITALANGAASIIPVETLKEAEKLRKKYPEYILAGERRGIKPKGFNLGNSPLEFTSEKVSRKNVILTTTSGTKALTRSKNAKWVLIGAFLNAKAAAEKSLKIAKDEEAGITLVSSGRKGSFSLEDFLCAGAIVENLGKLNKGEIELSDAAFAADLSFQQAHNQLYKNISKGEHARYLTKIGLERDVKFCSQLNCYQIVPFYRDGIITIFSKPKNSNR